MSWLRGLGAMVLVAAAAGAQEAPSMAGPMSHPPASAAAPVVDAGPMQPVLPLPVSHYDKTIFEKPLPSAQLSSLKQFDGAPAYVLLRDKDFKKLMKSVMPDCMFHYGRDRSLAEAMDMVMDGSRQPVVVREGRYLSVSGAQGQFLHGKGFVWIDLQEGVGLGVFYFTPTNGEPTPAINVFSRQIRDYGIAMSQLPPAFIDDYVQWMTAENIPPVETRYFLTGANKKILLEHDEDFCLMNDGSKMPADSGCESMNADAADLDMNAAYYLDQVHHATNATAWMLPGQDQVSFIEVRDSTCRRGPDPLGCRIRMTHERTRVILKK